MKVTSKNYDGKRYIKIGRKHIPLEQTVQYFENLEKENKQLKQQIEKMKCCGNCKFQDVYGDCVLESPIWCNKIYECGSDEWEFAE